MRDSWVLWIVLAAAFAFMVGARWQRHTRAWSDHKTAARTARQLRATRWKATRGLVLPAAIVGFALIVVARVVTLS